MTDLNEMLVVVRPVEFHPKPPPAARKRLVPLRTGALVKGGKNNRLPPLTAPYSGSLSCPEGEEKDILQVQQAAITKKKPPIKNKPKRKYGNITIVLCILCMYVLWMYAYIMQNPADS